MMYRHDIYGVGFLPPAKVCSTSADYAEAHAVVDVLL